MYVSMEPQQISATGVCDSAHDLWMNIKENHEGAEANLRSVSLAEFLSFRYRKTESLVSYAGRFELTLGKFESTDHKVDEKTKLWVFSNSLPQHMKQTVFMFTMAKPDEKVSELIPQLKVQHHMDNEIYDSVSAFQTREDKQTQRKNNKGNYGQNRFSDRNGAQCHDGNNSNTNQLIQGRSSELTHSQSMICSYCKNKGHLWKECRKLKADNDRKKKFSEFNKNRENNGSTQTETKTCAFSVNLHNFSEGKYTWIIDSGLSSHMTRYRSFLVDFEEFASPLQITLGDGKQLAVYGAGNIPFESGRYSGVLQRVLHVPGTTENLFSVGRAMEENCTVVFDHEGSSARF